MDRNSFQENLKFEVKKQGADFINFVDISDLTKKENRGYSSAVLVGIKLSKNYLNAVSSIPNYVEQKIENNQIHSDEFHLAEIKTDEIADYIANYISLIGFGAFSQSEKTLYNAGDYDKNCNPTPLHNKKIAVLGGLGWIGNNNLLVTTDFGSAISMCAVLTDAPIETNNYVPIESLCGDCRICKDICTVDALKGSVWKTTKSRDEMIDVNKCNPCLRCLVFCPWTKKYANKK